MSVTAVGPALDLDGPLPVEPKYGLLSIPGVLQERDANRQLNGVVVDAYPSDVPSSWEPCSSGTYRQKDEGDATQNPRFDPVGLYVPITCSALNFGRNWREWAARAEVVLEATLSFGVEKVLSQGVTGSTNEFFGDTDATIVGSGGNPLQALAQLEQAIGATGRRGIIHADPATGATWSQYLHDVGGYLETIGNGTPVAVGGGYIGAHADGNTPAAGTSYAFATGPVEVWATAPRLVGDDINGTLDTSNNDVTFRAERFVLAEWDTVLKVAALVDWTP